MLFEILIFIVVLGVLIFFHEMGHFIAAKACGIYCDRFSLGMPPRLFGIRLGETDYCIGALPVGGYVRMAGQEDAPLSDEEREKEYGHVPPERWFSNRPVWQRIIVLAAGPLMNLVLGVSLYGIVAAVGADVPEMKVDSRIGHVSPDAPAARASLYRVESGEDQTDYSREPDAYGWRTGDRILSINNRKIDNIGDVAVDAVLGAGRVLDVRIARSEPDGRVLEYLSPVEPKVPEGGEHARFGIEPFQTALVGGILEGQPAAGVLEPGDVIVRANGKPIDAVTFGRMVEAIPAGESIAVDVLRDGVEFRASISPARVGRFKGIVFQPPLYGGSASDDDALPVVAGISPEVAEASGLQPRDIIVEIDGRPATVALLRAVERANPGKQIAFGVRRPARAFGLIQEEERLTASVETVEVGVIGVTWAEKRVFHRVPPIQVVPEAFRLGYNALARTVQTVAMLVTGTVRVKDVGGPLLIFQVTTAAARQGLSWLLEMTAFISVNLCVLNLLPLPVLDGGLITLSLLEAVRGKPIEPKTAERIQKVGLVLIISLMLLVTYNDILRMITGSVL